MSGVQRIDRSDRAAQMVVACIRIVKGETIASAARALVHQPRPRKPGDRKHTDRRSPRHNRLRGDS